MLHSDITEKVISAFFKVCNSTGYGCLEKVYENAMAIELRQSGFCIEKQKNLKIYYETGEAGDYYADLVVNDLVIVESIAAKELCEEHEVPLISYLKAAKIEVGMLLNFGAKGAFNRKIFTNDKKSIDTDHPDAAGLHRLNP